MLVLTRKAGQAITIGDAVRIVVMAVDGDSHVKIGIEAPRSLPVHRAEVYDEILRQRKGKQRKRKP